MTSPEYSTVRDAISQISKGKDVNEDGWMVMWCNTNWGDLLQPAPLSIALLGSLMVIASSTNDFALVPDENILVALKYIKHPTSFKTCLQQMVGEGYAAFETASRQMTRINNASSQMPDVIKNVVMLITQSQSSQEIKALLPIELGSVLQLTKICIDASRECEKAFMSISALAQEILECATHKIGTVEQVTQHNTTHLTILKEQAEQEKKMVEEAKEASDFMKKSFSEAEKDFQSAVDKVPSGWGIMGMHVVENLTTAITSPLNALFGTSNVFGQYLQTGVPVGLLLGQGAKTTQPSGPALSDPGVSLVEQILGFVTGLSLLISGGPDGKPDWDNIRGSKDKSGGLYVEASLERLKDRLDGTKPISQELLPIIDQAVKVAKSVNAVANSVDGNDDNTLDQHKPVVKELIAALQGLVTRCNLILQQTGNIATGPGTPKDIQTTSSVMKTAVETAKFRVDQTRANLEAARDSYDRASARLIEGQRQIAKTIADMTKLSLENATLKDIMPVLTRAVKTFTTLRAQFSQMMQLFYSVSSLIDDVMQPQVSSWAKKVVANSEVILAGVTFSDWIRQAIYTQMMGPLKVSMLAERISGTYLRVSELYIMPAQRKVGHMLQFPEDQSEEGKRQFRVKLSRDQAVIQEESQTASEKILELVAADQQKFVTTINRRLAVIQDTVGRVLPAIKEPVPQQLTDVTKAHVEEFDRQKEATKNATPPYQVKDLM